MWLLDVNMPRKIAGFLGERRIVAQSAEDRGWGGLTNGALVEAAAEAGFRCILTRDRLFAESAARALKKFPEFSAVLVTIPQLRGAEFLRHFGSAWADKPIEPTAGRITLWPGR